MSHSENSQHSHSSHSSHSSHGSRSSRRRKRARRRLIKKILKGFALILAVSVVCFMVFVMTSEQGVPATGKGKISPAEETSQSETTEPTTEAATTEPVETTETEPATEETTEATETETQLSSFEEKALLLLEEMTLEEKIWQMFFLTPDDLTDTTSPSVAGEGTQLALQTYPVGGLIYFEENILSEEQIYTMITNTQSYSRIPLFIGVDEEGGYVSRLSRIGVVPRVDSMEDYGSAGDEQAVYDLGTTFAQGLKSVGFNLNFAPVADVLTNPDNTELRTRTFSDDPLAAGTMVSQMVKGLQNGNVISCLKHFPGHGSTSTDSHYGRAVSERTLEELREVEFLPFTEGIRAGAELVMISHMSLPAVTGDNSPCDLSYKVVTELLRQELGFEGLIVTDSHKMGAISLFYECGEAALKAVEAGCDVILMPEDKLEAFEAILTAVQEGTLTEERINESVLRILSLKYKYGIIAE